MFTKMLDETITHFVRQRAEKAEKIEARVSRVEKPEFKTGFGTAIDRLTTAVWEDMPDSERRKLGNMGDHDFAGLIFWCNSPQEVGLKMALRERAVEYARSGVVAGMRWRC